MQNLNYQRYLANPAISDALEREARRARAQAYDQYVVTPLIHACGRLLRGALQALLLILTLANYRFYSPIRISGPELNRSTHPRS